MKVNLIGHGFSVGNVIRASSASSYAKALANSDINSEALGIVTEVTDVASGLNVIFIVKLV